MNSSDAFGQMNVALFNIISRNPGTGDAKRARAELVRRARMNPRSGARELLQQLRGDDLMKFAPPPGVAEPFGDLSAVRLVTDREIDRVRQEMMAKAQREICIQTYVFDDDGAAQQLITAKKRGIQVIVNVSRGPAKRNKAAAEILTVLARHGINSSSSQSIHTKVLLCDRRHVVIGSANMRVTHRDAILQFESATLGARLHQLYFAASQSKQVTNGRA